MKSQIIIIALLLLLLPTIQTQDDRLKFDVYYEVLCPDSINFVTTQIRKAIETAEFEKIASIRLIPYGKAHQKKETDGTYSFTCQHGVNECFGNLLNSCAILYIQDSLDQLRFTDCLLGNINWKADVNKLNQVGESCAVKYGALFKDVQSCMAGPQGNSLQHEAGVETEGLNPKLTFVPWIVVNGSYDAAEQKEILSNIVAWTCKNYKGSVTIAACQ